MSTCRARQSRNRGALSWRAVALAAVTLLALPALARADVDVGNDWVVTFTTTVPPGQSITCDLRFVQTGSSLAASGTCRGVVSFASFVGTIDPATGAFSLSGEIAVNLTGEFEFVGISFQGAPVDGGSRLVGPATIADWPGSFVARLCGNGSVDAGESCDDGTATNGCCRSDCTPEPDGIACGTASACQVAPTCSAGVCSGAPKPAGTECEADGKVCTDDACDGAGSCAAGPCSPCCGPSCTTEARYDCKAPTDDKNLIDMQATPFGTRDKVVWRIPHMEATSAADLPDPQTNDYAVCFYVLDPVETFRLQFDALAPAGLGCRRKRCWTRNAKGAVAYNGGPHGPDGVASLRVKPGPDGKASLTFRGRGPQLDFGLPLFVPGGELLVQLRAGDGCWSALYVNDGQRPSVRTDTRYRKKGGS